MKCLVTGASGFIGNALVKKLVKEGYFVKALYHKNKPEKNLKNVEYVKCDITNPDKIKNVLDDVDVVFHCAAIVKDYGPKDIFYKVNVNGTKNLVKISKRKKIKKFIFLSHIQYDKKEKSNNYSKTKSIAEEFLKTEYKKSNFPVVIIRPGNVYGPGKATWVLRPLESIKKNRISLIDKGSGIFLHTYIDNLTDALITAIDKTEAIGMTINLTDGDHSITWKKYLNDLAKIANKAEIKKNMSKKTALLIGKIMIFLNKVFKIKPWITPTAVRMFTNKEKISIKKAKKILDYEPQIEYPQAMIEIEKWLKQNNYLE